MSSPLTLAFRGWRQLGGWYGTAWADAAETALTATQDGNSTADEKSNASMKLWAMSWAGLGLIANEVIDSAAILTEDPQTIVRVAVPVDPATLGVGTTYVPKLRADLVAIGGQTLEAARCYFEPTQISGPGGLEMVVDRRLLLNLRYKGTVDLHDAANPDLGVVPVAITVEL